jgi:hypothetical protein
MSSKKKMIFITVVVAIVAFALSQKVFVNSPDMPEPTSVQLPFFIVLGVIEALSMGYGIALLITYWKKAVEQKCLAVLVSVSWLIGSWWVHDGLHRMNGHDLAGLLKIEYGFHVTLIIAAVIVSCYVAKNLRLATPQ